MTLKLDCCDNKANLFIFIYENILGTVSKVCKCRFNCFVNRALVVFVFALLLAAVYSSKYSKDDYPQCVNSHASHCPDCL